MRLAALWPLSSNGTGTHAKDSGQYGWLRESIGGASELADQRRRSLRRRCQPSFSPTFRDWRKGLGTRRARRARAGKSRTCWSYRGRSQECSGERRARDAQLLYRRHRLRRLCSAPPDARCDPRATSRCGSRRYGGNQREDSARHVATPARRMNSTSPRRTSHGQASLHRPKQWLKVAESATAAALMVD